MALIKCQYYGEEQRMGKQALIKRGLFSAHAHKHAKHIVVAIGNMIQQTKFKSRTKLFAFTLY